MLREKVFSIMYALFGIYLFLFLRIPNLWASTFPLDKETIFCIYYKLSGEVMNDEDIEDLYFELGRPTFTPHKPSEMFIKGSLINLKNTLMRKIREIDKDSLFGLNIKCTFMPKENTHKNPGFFLDQDTIPQPTPYIRSEIPNKGLSLITKQIHSFVTKRSLASTKTKTEDVIIYLRPDRIEYAFETRNVAREKVVLPIRYVIFQPVKLKMFNEIVTIEN